MYNIWCEVKKVNVVLVVIGIFFSLGELFMGSRYDYGILIVTLLLGLVLIKSVFKYLSLKKYGILIEVSYELKPIKNNERVLVVDYQLSDGKYIQLFKKKLNWGDIKSVGTTKLLINPSNLKQYFIFDPINN